MTEWKLEGMIQLSTATSEGVGQDGGAGEPQALEETEQQCQETATSPNFELWRGRGEGSARD